MQRNKQLENDHCVPEEGQLFVISTFKLQATLKLIGNWKQAMAGEGAE